MNRAQLAKTIVAEELTELEASIRIIWFVQRANEAPDVAIGEVFAFFTQESISQPNRSRLQTKLLADRRVLKGPGRDRVRLRAVALQRLDEEFETAQPSSPAAPLVAALEAHVQRLPDSQTRSFVAEAVSCVRNKAPRAAIILAWCGAVSILQEHVFTHRLTEFNADAVKNGLLKVPALTVGDMRGISKESHFLESLARISVIDEATKRALKRCLDRRNDVGHPSEVRLADAAVADHLETLMLNVFERFAA